MAGSKPVPDQCCLETMACSAQFCCCLCLYCEKHKRRTRLSCLHHHDHRRLQALLLPRRLLRDGQLEASQFRLEPYGEPASPCSSAYSFSAFIDVVYSSSASQCTVHAISRRAAALNDGSEKPMSTRAAGAGGSSSTMMRLYTSDDSPGLKVWV